MLTETHGSYPEAARIAAPIATLATATGFKRHRRKGSILVDCDCHDGLPSRALNRAYDCDMSCCRRRESLVLCNIVSGAIGPAQQSASPTRESKDRERRSVAMQVGGPASHADLA